MRFNKKMMIFLSIVSTMLLILNYEMNHRAMQLKLLSRQMIVSAETVDVANTIEGSDASNIEPLSLLTGIPDYSKWQDTSNSIANYVTNENVSILDDYKPLSASEIKELDQDIHQLPIIANLKIELVGLQLPVFKSLNDTLLYYGAGTMQNISFDRGNAVLMAHDSKYQGLLFEPLKRVKKGDIATIVTLDGEYRYEVINISHISENDVEVMNRTRQPMLTLITCDTRGDQRLLVQAKRLSE